MTIRPISKDLPLALGSASPRRREILLGLGIPIRVQPADVSEARRGSEAADAYLARIVRDKLMAVATLLDASAIASSEGEGSPASAAILVADTIVVVEEDVLGKPKDELDAERLLSRIVGRAHWVKTRYAIALPDAWRRPGIERTVETRVVMRHASADEIRRYARTGEGLDKAGAYAAQGIGAFLIEAVSGSYTNVVGLPACEVVLDLRALGLLRDFP
jgi:septum formation protein